MRSCRRDRINGRESRDESMKVNDRKETMECLDRDILCTLVSLFPSLNIR